MVTETDEQKIARMQEIVNRGIVGDLPPEKQAIIREAIKRGMVKPAASPDYLGAAGTIASSIVTEPASGLVGAGRAAYEGVANLFRGENEQVDPMLAGAQAVETFQGYANQAFGPKDEAERLAMQNIANAPVVKQIGEGMVAASQGAGEGVYNLTGSPGAAAFTEGAVMAAPEALGLRGASKLSKRTGGLIDETLTPEQLKAQRIIESGKQFDVPVMTSDVRPPKTFIGGLRQRLSDDLGMLGTGGKRAAQQEARESAITSLVDDLDIEIDSDFSGQIVDSLNAKNKQVMNEAMNERIEAISMLDDAGYIDPQSAIAKLDEVIARENAKSIANRDQSVIDWATQFKQDLQTRPMSFREMASERTVLINNSKDTARMQKSSEIDRAYKETKAAIDEDMIGFAKEKNRDAAAKWLSSNRKFADEFDEAKISSVKRILEKGDATPEQVVPILKSAKPSELRRLYNRLDEKGRIAAQKTLIQEALKDSGYFGVDAKPNPDKFATALNRPSYQQAMNVFFKEDMAGLKNLHRVLENTRSAQNASAVPKTGYAIGAGYGGSQVLSNPFAVGVGALSIAALKLYETPAFRNMLMKLDKVDKKEAAKLMAEMSGMITTAAIKAQQQEDASVSPYRMQTLQARIAQGDPDAIRELDRINQANAEREQMAVRQEANNFQTAALNYGANFLEQVGAKNDMALETALDIRSMASRPLPIAKQLIDDLYEVSGVPQNAPIAKAFADVYSEIGEASIPFKNVLQNNGLLPPDDKSTLINKMIAMGTNPDNAVKTANKLNKLNKKTSQQVIAAIKSKIPDGQYKTFKPLIDSIEAAV